MPTKTQPGFMLWAVPRFHRQANGAVAPHTQAAGNAAGIDAASKLRFFSGPDARADEHDGAEPHHAARVPALQH
ncbi:hypothetical protein [Acidocella sp.]|uniref:hypothetical protein n=1 Tax=Acidocella sp. TaxID=50710 RepID=UPI00261098D4|nr:hypothetical protein [Acidocella sp.]